MKGIILYKSKYGATEKYARWLSEETGFPAAEIARADLEEVEGCGCVILCGGVYASGFAALPFLKKNLALLKNKRLFVLCVGASPYDEEAFQEGIRRNMKEGLEHIPCFYARGAWDLDRMNLIDRNLCKLLRKTVAKKDPSTYAVWEKALMAAGDAPCDWTDRAYLKPLLDAVRAG